MISLTLRLKLVVMTIILYGGLSPPRHCAKSLGDTILFTGHRMPEMGTIITTTLAH